MFALISQLNMRFVMYVLTVCVFTCLGITNAEEETTAAPMKYNEPAKVLNATQPYRSPTAPLKFPKRTDSSTPILKGNDPKHSNLPPHLFPRGPMQFSNNAPAVLPDTAANTTEKKLDTHEAVLDSTHENTTAEINNNTKPLKPEIKKDADKSFSEQQDMLHSKYSGGEDVDELKKLPKKVADKSGKKSKENPKSDIDISPSMDHKGPKLLNTTQTRSRGSMLESTSTVMAVSSSVLANAKPKHEDIIQPAQTLVSVLVSAAVVLGLGVVGVMIWNKIAMRRFGRDVLINEEDFDEVSDMHSFDRAQIKIT